jgi:chemotaxis methyl-accepting protein methylase
LKLLAEPVIGTQAIAETAFYVLATDINQQVIDVARAKGILKIM